MLTRSQSKMVVFQPMAILAVASAFGLLAYAGIMLTRDEGRIAIVWLPNALMVAILLRSNFRQGMSFVPAALIANILVDLSVGDDALRAVTLSLINQFEILSIWMLMRKIGLPRPDMQNLNDLVKFGLIGGICAPVASGFFAALFLSSGDGTILPAIWIKWASTDGLGMLLLAPAMMALIDNVAKKSQGAHSIRPSLLSRKTLEWIAIQGSVLLAGITLFGIMPFAMFFLVAPLILLSTFRLGAWGTAVSTVTISVVVAVCVSLKLGPFNSVDISLTAKLIIMQMFLLSCFVVGFPVAAVLAGKDKIRKELRAHKELSNSMLQNIPEVIFRTNEQDEWVFLNPAWEELTGLSVEKSIGRKIENFIPSATKQFLIDELVSMRNGDVDDCQFGWAFHRRDRTAVHVELTISKLRDDEGNFIGTVGNIRDITDQRAMEVNLVNARRHAEAAADAKSRFLANMSHEIRTPMNGVLGFTQLLLDSELTSEQHQQMQMILDSGNAMMRLLNDILDISKIEAGQATSDLKPIDIAHVLNSCIKLLAPSAEQKGLLLRLEIDDSLPEKVVGDSHHLRQIILNLLGNAVKFTQAGSVILRASAQDGDDATSMIQIDIEDTGIGISPKRQTAIFDPFEQAEEDTSRQYGVSGLGLTISQQLAVVMGGDLSVSSTPGTGTTFSLSFPGRLIGSISEQEREDMEIELLGKPLPSGPAPEQNGQVKARLLLAEDHDINQILITAMTDRLGYETTLAVDGADAVAKVDAAIKAGQPFDLVLMDVQMPMMDGYQATRMIRTSGITADMLPIIAITANAFSDDIEGCLAAGMQAHIAKPVMIAKLKAALAEWIPAKDDEKLDPAMQTPCPLLDGELRDKYQQRKDDVLLCLTSLVRSATYSDDELREASDHLHKLAGTAAMFGDPDLGIKAKLIENGLKQWKIEDRPQHMLVAVSDFLRAA